jgi:TPR repeat protein
MCIYTTLVPSTALFDVAAAELRFLKANETLDQSEVLSEASAVAEILLFFAAAAQEAPLINTTLSPLVAPAAKSEGESVSLSYQDMMDDCMAHCFTYLGTAADRSALQCTSKQFQRISNRPEVLGASAATHPMVLGGDRTKGTLGIIRENDTALTANEKLEPFVAAGHLEACHMMGVINIYCRLSWNTGVKLLKQASKQGYVQSMHALGLVLRDVQPKEAVVFMRQAAKAGYYPAEMELLRTRKLRRRNDGLKPKGELLNFMDSQGLNQLLTRDHAEFFSSADVFAQETHQCCSPTCGKWAYDKHPVVCWPVRKRLRRCLMTSRKIGHPSAAYCSKICEKHHELTLGGGRVSLRERFVRAMQQR